MQPRNPLISLASTPGAWGRVRRCGCRAAHHLGQSSPLRRVRPAAGAIPGLDRGLLYGLAKATGEVAMKHIELLMLCELFEVSELLTLPATSAVLTPEEVGLMLKIWLVC